MLIPAIDKPAAVQPAQPTAKAATKTVAADHPIYAAAKAGDFDAVYKWVADVAINPNYPSAKFGNKSAMNLLIEAEQAKAASNRTNAEVLESFVRAHKYDQPSDWAREYSHLETNPRVQKTLEDALVALHEVVSIPARKASTHTTTNTIVHGVPNAEVVSMVKSITGYLAQTTVPLDALYQVVHKLDEKMFELCRNEKQGAAELASSISCVEQATVAGVPILHRICGKYRMLADIAYGLGRWVDWFGVNPLRTDNKGRTLLHHVFEHNPSFINNWVYYLSGFMYSAIGRSNIRFDVKDDMGLTPVHYWALALNKEECGDMTYFWKYLDKAKNNGFSIVEPDNVGMLPLHYLFFELEKTKASIVNFLDKSYPRDNSDYPQVAEFSKRGGEIDIIKKFRVDINTPDPKGNTIGHYYANQQGSGLIMRQLQSCGAYLSIPNNAGYTALHLLAARNDWGKGWWIDNEGRTRGITELDKWGREMAMETPDLRLENLNLKDPQGKPPLVYAAEHGNALAFLTMIHAGAEPNIYWLDARGQKVYAWDLLESRLSSGDYVPSRIKELMLKYRPHIQL